MASAPGWSILREPCVASGETCGRFRESLIPSRCACQMRCKVVHRKHPWLPSKLNLQVWSSTWRSPLRWFNFARRFFFGGGSRLRADYHKSSYIANEAELNQYMQRKSITGIINTTQNPFGSAVADNLRETNREGVLSSAWQLEELRELPSAALIWGYFIAAFLCFALVLACCVLFWIKRPRRVVGN